MPIPIRTVARADCAQRGLTLVELLVSVALGILVIGVVLYSYVGSKGTYRSTKSSSRVQEAGHFGLDAIVRDVRSAGFVGCGSRTAVTYSTSGTGTAAMSVYQIANPNLPIASTGDAMIGYMPTTYQAQGAGSGWALAQQAAPAPWIAGDVLTLRIATGAPVGMPQDPDPTKIYLNNNCSNVGVGTYLMVSNCSYATILRASEIQPLPAAQACPASGLVKGGYWIQHTSAQSCNGKACNLDPANSGNPNPGLAPGNGNRFPAATMSMVQQFDEVTYYVGQVPPVGGIAVRPPALYRYSAAAASLDAQHASEEIIDHVENMVITYGVLVNNAIVCEDAGLVQATNAWANVRSVRISLLATGDEAGAVDNPQSFTLGECQTGTGTTQSAKTIQIPATAGDTRMHQIFTATASLGNKLD